MKISASELPNLINSDISGTTTVSLDIVTDPQMRKTGNPFLGVKKHQTLNGLLGTDYAAGINRQADREDKEHRETQQRSWGNLSENRVWVYKDGQLHSIQLRVLSATNIHFRMPDGTEVEKDQLRPFLPEPKVSSTQADLDKPIVIRDIKVQNVRRIRIKNCEFELE